MTPQEKATIASDAMNLAFMLHQAKTDDDKARIQETVTASSGITTGGILPMVVDKINTGIKPVDEGWKPFYRMVSLPGVNSFNARNIVSGLTFSAINEGTDCTIYAFSGTKTNVSIDTYRAGIDFSMEVLEEGSWYELTDAATELYSKFHESKASYAYDLIQKVANTSTYNVVYSGISGTTTVDKDANVINSACEELITDGKATAGSQFVFVAPLAMKSRVDRALVGSQNASADGTAVAYNVYVTYSPLIDFKTEGAVTGGTAWQGANGAADALPLGYLTVSGARHKFVDAKELTLDEANNIKSYSKTIVGVGRFAGYVDASLVRRVLSV